jgi:hypothetical protein
MAQRGRQAETGPTIRRDPLARSRRRGRIHRGSKAGSRCARMSGVVSLRRIAVRDLCLGRGRRRREGSSTETMPSCFDVCSCLASRYFQALVAVPLRGHYRTFCRYLSRGRGLHVRKQLPCGSLGCAGGQRLQLCASPYAPDTRAVSGRASTEPCATVEIHSTNISMTARRG